MVTIMSPAKMAELIEMFGEADLHRPEERFLNAVHMGATWRIRLNNPC